jgi:hypothetical protein
MTDNKLIELFQILSGPEKRECTNFLKSPYFNQRSDVLGLWEFLLLQKGKDFTQEAAWNAVYFDKNKPSEQQIPFSNANWRYLQSFLLAQIENFLAQRSFEKTPLMADLHLSSVFREKNHLKPIEFLLQRAEEKLEKIPKHHAFFHHQYLLEWEKYAAAESQGRDRTTNLAAVAKAFDIYTICGKLRHACLMESHKAVFQASYDDTFLPLLLQYLENSDLLKEPTIALYYFCYKALQGGQSADFQQFKTEMANLPALFPDEERRALLLLAVNFCIRRLNSGEEKYANEALDFYEIGLQTGALLDKGQLGRFAYKNIAALGLKLGKFDWVESFLKQYAPFLGEKYREAHYDYNLAKLFFSKKDYNRAMPLLARVDETDLLLNLDSRVMLLKMYYETEEWNALDALLTSFKIMLLRKKKVIGYHQVHYLNTLRYVQKLTNLRFKDKKAVLKLREEVEANKSVIEKVWILEKLQG